MYYCIWPYQIQYPNQSSVYRHNNHIQRAFAEIKGGSLAPNIHGYVVFTETGSGVDVFVEVNGLPPFQRGKDRKQIGPHGFHIHEKGSCAVGDATDPFQAAGGHWNPTNEPHGNHAGDLPVLFSNNGYSRMNVFTNKFHVQDVIGKTIIIHEGPDDFRTEPAGNSGKRLACGLIRPYV
ncbi:superoxide dismutase family protein [Bacillus andreraoultii]|uniref:superoxide dismutase family protein n=1 Tax=Bacillus andreraoultii TaxID=1499685 RepID=UPI000539A158